MEFLVSSTLEYETKFPSTLIMSILAQRSPAQEILSESLQMNDGMTHEEIEVDGNRFLIVQTRKVKKFQVTYEAKVDVSFDVLPAREFDPQSIAQFDGEAISFLFPSRYCQSDELSRYAWDYFGDKGTPYETVHAICDWIYENVEYLPGTTNSRTSAYDTITQRTGVCRDFAHLGIALCRALNIPARYLTAYAYQLDPPDFHALFEAYIGGRWLIFDPTRLSYPNGIVKIANGKDAADAAVASIFGRVSGKEMNVCCKLAPGQDFKPMDRKRLEKKAVALDLE